MRRALAVSLVLIPGIFFAQEIAGRRAPELDSSPKLRFAAIPQKPKFESGEKIAFTFRIRNAGLRDVLVARPFLLNHYVWLRILGPEGKEVPWCGKIDGRIESAKEFSILHPGAHLQSNVRLSCDEHRDAGYVFSRPGKYAVFGEYHLPQPKEWLKQIAGKALVTKESVKAPPVQFWIVKRDEAN